MALSRQCELAGVSRSWLYVQSAVAVIDEEDRLLCRLIDEPYTSRPFYGSRRMVVYLRGVNRKHVPRLMRPMGLAGLAPGPNTSRPHSEHKVYPYLLRGLAITKLFNIIYIMRSDSTGSTGAHALSRLVRSGSPRCGVRGQSVHLQGTPAPLPIQ